MGLMLKVMGFLRVPWVRAGEIKSPFFLKRLKTFREMKKLITIILMFVCVAASAQLKKVNNNPLSDYYMFEVGDYVFRGYNNHGLYELSCDIGYDEAKALVDFIYTNQYKFNEKYGFTIKEVYETRASIYKTGVKTVHTAPCVVLNIITDEYYEWKEIQKKREQERLNSLTELF